MANEQVIEPVGQNLIWAQNALDALESIAAPLSSWAQLDWFPSWLVPIAMILIIYLIRDYIKIVIQVLGLVLAWLWMAVIVNLIRWIIHEALPNIKGIFLNIGNGIVAIVKTINTSVFMFLAVAISVATTFLTEFNEQITNFLSELTLPTIPNSIANADYSGILYLIFNVCDFNYFLVRVIDLLVLYVSISIVVIILRFTLKILRII